MTWLVHGKDCSLGLKTYVCYTYAKRQKSCHTILCHTNASSSILQGRNSLSCSPPDLITSHKEHSLAVFQWSCSHSCSMSDNGLTLWMKWKYFLDLFLRYHQLLSKASSGSLLWRARTQKQSSLQSEENRSAGYISQDLWTSTSLFTTIHHELHVNTEIFVIIHSELQRSGIRLHFVFQMTFTQQPLLLVCHV